MLPQDFCPRAVSKRLGAHGSAAALREATVSGRAGGLPLPPIWSV